MHEGTRARAHLGEPGGGVDGDGLRVLDRAIRAVLLQARGVVEVAGRNGLADGVVVARVAD